MIRILKVTLGPMPHQPNRRLITALEGPTPVAYDDTERRLALLDAVENDPKFPESDPRWKDVWVRVNDFAAWGAQS